MIGSMKRWASSVLPSAVIDGLRGAKFFFLTRAARQVFTNAIASREPLDSRRFAELLKRYPVTPKDYKYDQSSRDARATLRATHLLSLSGESSFNRFLELGCGDAMVSCMLARAGKTAGAIDLNVGDDFDEKSATGVDQRARAAGVECRQMDAHNLAYPEDSFDFVFSYNSFEHFSEPMTVLSEAHRVTRIGGKIYLSFAPLYHSPFGAHSTHIIAIPYFRLLFDDAVIGEYLKTRGLGIEILAKVNGWSVQQYETLWRQCSNGLRVISYRKGYTLSHLGLVEEFAPWLKRKVGCFDDLITGSIEILFEKTTRTLRNRCDHYR